MRKPRKSGVESLPQENPSDIIKKALELNDNTLLIEGYDDCVVGVCSTYKGCILLYSEKQIIKKLMTKLSKKEAWYEYEYNIVDKQTGENAPIFLID